MSVGWDLGGVGPAEAGPTFTSIGYLDVTVPGDP
jgi:hypothetical protein